jgi:prephenate dehydrogenase
MGKMGIIGLGLIGGSMGLALKRAKLNGLEVLGYDREREVAERALRAGAIDAVVPAVETLAADAALIVIATPILSVRSVLRDIASHLQRGSVVTDTASTKGQVIEWAEEILPRGVHFVGGHPMAGKEKSGPQAAEATLFEDRPYAIVPSLDAPPAAVNAVIGLAAALKARPFFVDAAEHDSYAAAISHIPLVASIALFSLARGSLAWPELANMSGPAFRDLTRLASGEPEMAHDIFLTNRPNVIHWIQRLVGELKRLEELIESGDEEQLFKALAETQIERDKFLESPPRREEPGAAVDLPTPAESFMGLLAGGLWAQRAREMTQALETRQKERQEKDRLRRREP